MLSTRLRAAPLIALFAPSSVESDKGGEMPARGRGYLIALGVASIVVLGLLLFGLGVFNPPAASVTSSTITSTSYAVDASSVIASAGNHVPAGYVGGSPKPLNAKEPGLESAGYATFSNQGGSTANMTIFVFGNQSSALTYIDRVIANTQDLSGYSNLTFMLSGYQHYGTCYGYGETDPEGAIAVANGVCTKGNVYIQVHLATSSSLASAEDDMSSLVGAAYQGVG
jgi:hypothetical protein